MIPLTARQMEVLKGVVRAKPYKAIAHDLGISMSTVIKHVEAVHHKTGTHNAVALTHWAIKNFIVSAGDFER